MSELYSIDPEAEKMLNSFYNPAQETYPQEEERELSDYGKKQNKKILIIGEKQEFLVGSIKTVLQEKMFDVTICDQSVTEVSKADQNITLYLVMVEYVSTMSSLMIYLRDKIFDDHIQVCVICHKGEMDDIRKMIPENEFAKVFYRPINIKEVVTELNAIYIKTNGEAKKKSILLVDDDPAFLKRTQNILRSNYKVYIVTSGAAAIKMLSNHHVDLIMLDYDMPIIDGPHVYQMIKAETDYTNIPIMFLSGRQDVESVKNAVMLKPEKYITKSMQAAELLSTINDYFAYNSKST